MKTKLSITSLALPLLAVLLSLTSVAAAQPGFISTVAGTGTFGFNGDGIPATSAQLFNPVGVFVDGSRNLFIGELNNHRVRKVDGVTGIYQHGGRHRYLWLQRRRHPGHYRSAGASRWRFRGWLRESLHCGFS